ncbi:MAG: phage holin family protein [Pseudomonadota bacterium]|nr:phage holin family protein [Pseudomonadota bacterium]
MRLLWLLPKVAPVLLRHMMGYVDLAGLELEQSRRDFGTRMLAAAILGVCIVFLLFSGCLLVVALTWDTPYRVAAVAWIAGGFLLAALIAAAYGRQVAKRQVPFFGTVRREWEEDRVILERLLASDEDRP